MSVEHFLNFVSFLSNSNRAPIYWFGMHSTHYTGIVIDTAQVNGTMSLLGHWFDFLMLLCSQWSVQSLDDNLYFFN